MMGRKEKQDGDEEENRLTKTTFVHLLLKKHIAHLYKGVNVVHQSLGSANDELVHTGYGMGPAKMTGQSCQPQRCLGVK